jgi:hypothetical protein
MYAVRKFTLVHFSCLLHKFCLWSPTGELLTKKYFRQSACYPAQFFMLIPNRTLFLLENQLMMVKQPNLDLIFSSFWWYFEM